MVEINSEDAELLCRIDARLTEIEAKKRDSDTNTEERAALDEERLALEKEGADILSENEGRANEPEKEEIGMPVDRAKKCAHPACNCPAPADNKYCSQYCHDSGNSTEIMCNCRHPACEGEAPSH